MVPFKHRIRPTASNDLAVPSLCICLLFISVPLLVSVILGLTIIILNAGSRRQWSAFLTTKKVLRYDACAVKSDFCCQKCNQSARTRIRHGESQPSALRASGCDSPVSSSGTRVWFHTSPMSRDAFHEMLAADWPATGKEIGIPWPNEKIETGSIPLNLTRENWNPFHPALPSRIMYELEVCSDGTTEAQPRSFRQNRPTASTLSDIMQVQHMSRKIRENAETFPYLANF